jgi:lipopolysaccharide export system protein LptC
MTYRNTFLSLFFFATIAILAWSTYFADNRHKSVPLIFSNVPDAFMEDVVSVIMDKEGNPKIKIETPKMVHFLKDDTTRLVSPYLTLYRGTPEPWYIKSRYAKASDGIETVDFWENVQIDHSADEHSPTTTIKTKTLTLYPNKHTAETADLITMIQPNLVVNATGMFADMNTGDIKLLSQARGEYVPDQSN